MISMSSQSERLQFPDSWLKPTVPGYGTYPGPFAGQGGYHQAARATQPCIEQALLLGYRHIDTAFSYGKQDQVGAAIRAQGIPRQKLFVTSKLLPRHNTYKAALSCIQEAIDLIWGSAPAEACYLDAFLLHYPGRRDPVSAWKALLKARETGWVKHPGVSNFEIRHLQGLREASGQYPEINQIEFHPYLYSQQRELLEFCKANGITLEGYSPLAQGDLLQEPEVCQIAEAYATTPARVILRWCMQHGVRPIVGTRNPTHLETNFHPYNFSLSEEEMRRLDAISQRKTVRVSLRWGWDPPNAPLGSCYWLDLTQRILRRVGRTFRRS